MPSTTPAADYLQAQIFYNLELAKRLQDVVLWAETVWLVRGNPDTPYDIKGFEFLREPVNSKARRVVIMSSSGVGKTELFQARALARASWGRRVIYGFESQHKTSLIVQERLNPNIRNSPYLRRLCDDVDNIQLKRVGKGLLYSLGLSTESATASFHADDLIRDEFNLMDRRIATDMEHRLASSVDPTIVDLGNPDQPGDGIHQAFEEGDRRRWHLTCPKCKVELPLSWKTHVDRAKLIIACPGCSAEMDRKAAGRWLPTNPIGKYPSYHIHRLMAPNCDLAEMRDRLASSERPVVRAATRFMLGEPFEDADSGLTMQDLTACEGPQPWGTRAPGGFMVVDPGKLFDVQIFKKRTDLRVEDDHCVWAGTVNSWAELGALVQDSGVISGLIDYMPELKQAQEFCQEQARMGRLFKRVAYAIHSDLGQDWVPDSEDRLLIKANRTLCCDKMVADVRAGRLRYPSRLVRDPESRFAKHMISPRRVLEPDRSGIPKPRWDHDESRPDHQFHCSVYASIWRQAFLKASSGTAVASSWGSY